jgi:1-aminocyclopropane-1-carboxylate deaminase/D-cysteine desulfhydrase-like pyridoxal-dependent ACC family enzyme
VQVTTIQGPEQAAQQRSFSIIRDDLLHPIAGSKMRKFDALWPQMLRDGVTDVVSW